MNNTANSDINTLSKGEIEYFLTFQDRVVQQALDERACLFSIFHESPLTSEVERSRILSSLPISGIIKYVQLIKINGSVGIHRDVDFANNADVDIAYVACLRHEHNELQTVEGTYDRPELIVEKPDGTIEERTLHLDGVFSSFYPHLTHGMVNNGSSIILLAFCKDVNAK